ncbi:cbb3-type cytochrome c oxidase N-terminal domain-containing protein [Mongoliitalea daihaiensis]|uniref:cbb3-type cytochrome c oxidase N-terminal domain-containing protein n=1 Tax=Mongoliitalea daihaiensis TaxID=2782006 RepID=UPI001F3E3E60|nr:cbb3-type cytochrome c oxidase N-terminal domain-containing protein [Mongoliitalea daihaiensis]UJP66865.1 c-type cytochrome [Mongoliitalea daihaiensis]
MKKFKFLLIMMLGLASALPASAQTSEMNWVSNLQSLDSSQATLLVIMGVVLFVIVLLLVLMIYLMSFMVAVFKKENPALAAQPTWWDEFKLKYIVGKMKPVGGKEEKELMLDHSYDGIVELDNHMPPWLANVFYITIAFAVVYFTYYSVLGLGKTQLEEYAEEQRVAAIKIEAYKATLANLIDETNVEFDESAAALAAGKSIYSANCAACHAADGGGGVGPNFTDEYWIHGGSINDIFRIVKYGVPAKGMIPWQDQLSPEEMQQVSSYIKTLVGTTPANPKAPEGELYRPAAEEEAEVVSDEAIAEAI